jgi:hypothetical protein
VHRQPRIADALQLEFRILHQHDMTDRFGCALLKRQAQAAKR